jgi:hypothetical protein
VRKVFDWWLADGLITPGSSLAIWVVGTSVDTTRLVYMLTVPAHVLGERVAFVLAARQELATLLAERPEKNASAIAEAFHVAVSTLRERVGRYRVVMLSDLRQVTPRTWNFEQVVPPPHQFLAWWKMARLLVDLQGVPVRVCGLSQQQGPGTSPSSASLLPQLRDTWESTLKAMGATEVGLFTACEAAFPL